MAGRQGNRMTEGGEEGRGKGKGKKIVKAVGEESKNKAVAEKQEFIGSVA